MRRRFNYAVAMGPAGVEWEADYATCGHCSAQMRVKPAKDGRVIVRVMPPCPGCKRYICDECMKTPGCKTWEKKLDEIEAAENRLHRLILG